jgi:hypothetical protein
MADIERDTKDGVETKEKGGNIAVLLVGPPAVGKTTLLMTYARQSGGHMYTYDTTTKHEQYETDPDTGIITAGYDRPYDFYYDDVEEGRKATRGIEATLGDEWVGYSLDDTSRTTDIRIYSQGGHSFVIKAELSPRAVGFVIDYPLIKQLSTLSSKVQPETLTINGETFGGTIISFMENINAIYQHNVPTLLIVTKYPCEESLPDDILPLLTGAYQESVRFFMRYADYFERNQVMSTISIPNIAISQHGNHEEHPWWHTRKVSSRAKRFIPRVPTRQQTYIPEQISLPPDLFCDTMFVLNDAPNYKGTTEAIAKLIGLVEE